ncbi:PASTA domain-containing protein, partial [Saccharothrix sp. ST-888]|uniref:PASTA domain-containing protein n=1 Tax=Saccharothrix sp. ST-888 TaxID=1427391 RepID=UPI0005ED3BB4
GQRVRKSDPVKVTLSKGPQRITVHALAGKPLEQARKALTDAGLAPGTTPETYSDSAPQGPVSSARPAGGQQVAVNRPVAMVGSKAMTRVPDAGGMTKDGAA